MRLRLLIIIFSMMFSLVLGGDLEAGEYKKIEINKIEDIQSMTDKKSVPRVVYSVGEATFKDISSIPIRKIRFYDVVVPTALIVREEIEVEREKIKKMIEGETQVNFEYLANLYEIYRVENNDIEVLYEKMKPVPVSVLLSQAIIESGWGTSRIFEEANNIFGVWSLNSTEPRIKATGSRGNKQIYLRKYDTMKGSIEDYMRLLARHNAYSDFRKVLKRTSDYKKLIPHLNKYSELGEEYVERLRKTIEYNDLDRFDSYELRD